MPYFPDVQYVCMYYVCMYYLLIDACSWVTLAWDFLWDSASPHQARNFPLPFGDSNQLPFEKPLDGKLTRKVKRLASLAAPSTTLCNWIVSSICSLVYLYLEIVLMYTGAIAGDLRTCDNSMRGREILPSCLAVGDVGSSIRAQ